MVNEKSIRKMRTGVILGKSGKRGIFDHPAILGDWRTERSVLLQWMCMRTKKVI